MSIRDLFCLTNKVAIISGGAGLLGEKHAEAIAEFGGIPILLDINEKLGAKKSIQISEKYEAPCEFIYCDITKESQIIEVTDKILDQFGHIDILINNAAIDPKVEQDGETNFSRLENFPIEMWEKEIKVGLTGAMILSKIVGEVMANQGEGVILNIASDLGVIAPDQRIYNEDDLLPSEQPVKPVTYSVIKHGLIGLTKYLSTYWIDKGVRCNALSPGGIYSKQNSKFVKKLTNLIPLGRMANKDEYKASVVFLVSEASSYMNGSNLIIDGGRSSW